ncbi:DUF2891 domain-containing protein [Ornithinimicrobium pekingense]|uniref:DUF2891 domain-containing protein n=1 Tax=Ornithinimicrobium pekingense TaxID=384677 RepID=A0ABQ2FBU0_9MICO|nr:DUF2891 domain-containing protein [Ornithinimicrobium pekingense]GGK79014.1 hypothetical protein GCM10011509_29450 [Ornithinimicrobium pekingense]
MTDAAPTDAAAWSRVARAVVATPYPWSPGHTVLGPDDGQLVPEQLHPAFHGSLDWHSCVHMQWSLVTLLTRYGDALGRDEHDAVVALLGERLRPEHVAVEVAYLQARPGFERPYGWAWAAQLVAALTDAARDGAAPHTSVSAWAGAVAPLGEAVCDLVLGWLPRQAYPVRHGKHQNDAFALWLLRDAAERLGRDDVVTACRQRALDWFGDDADAPTAWEPGGTDFLSPALTEAGLMSRVLPGREYAAWLGRFLPGLGEGRHEHLLVVPVVGDATDGQYAHLLGLALSRAWQLRELAPHLPPAAADRLRAGADAQEAAVLQQITDGDFMATHWLVSFALLARGVLGGAREPHA